MKGRSFIKGNSSSYHVVSSSFVFCPTFRPLFLQLNLPIFLHTPSPAPHYNSAIAKAPAPTKTSALTTPFLPALLSFELVAAGAEPVLVGLSLSLPSPVFASTYNSPLESLDTNSLPFPSNARPTGRKQLPGQTVVSGLEKIS